VRSRILRFLAALILTAGVPALAQQRPNRDSTVQRRPTGTASIMGRVVSADTGRALARARVSVTLVAPADGVAASQDSAGTSSETMTDHAGAFVFAGLAAGTYTITGSKAAYLSMAYGARRPQRPGKRVGVKQGQQVRDIDVRLPRGSVVSGRVYDDAGEPIVRATVQAMRQSYLQGEPRLMATGTAQTDDRGQFRIYGLVPGSYVVAASAFIDVPRGEDGRPQDAVALTYAPTYYPGVTNTADAVPILLGVQQEYSSVDFMLQTVATARVSGTVGGDPAALAGAMVILFVDDPRGVAGGSTYGGRVREDGTFSIVGVPPGRYLAVARSALGGPGRGGMGQGTDARTSPMVGILPLSVAGQDVSGVSIVLSPGGTIAGWVTLESANNRRVDFNQLRLSTMPLTPVAYGGGGAARIQADGSFTIANVAAGSHLVRLDNPPGGWALKGVFVNGRDVSDQALEVKSGQTTSGVQVVLTDRLTSLAVTVVDASSRPVIDCSVVLFPVDITGWRPRSRMIQGTQPDDNGTYRFATVPPGDYYLAVADDLEPGSWYDPLLLGELSKTATRVSLEEGDAKTVTLQAKSPSTEN
jgi:hypothetical protein